MKVGDTFIVDGKKYEVVEGICYDCAFRHSEIGVCTANIDIFNCDINDDDPKMIAKRTTSIHTITNEEKTNSIQKG